MLGELWKKFLELHAKPHKRSWPTDERRYTGHLERLADEPLKTFTTPYVSALLAEIAATSGPGAANRVRALGHKMFVWARKDEGLAVENPFADTARNDEHRKDRHLQPDELRRFWQVVKAEGDGNTRDFLTLLLLTAVRAGTLASAAVGRHRPRRRAPGTSRPRDMKAGKPLTLPLAPRTVALLEERRQFTADPWVFPSPRTAIGHLSGVPREGWKRVLLAAGLDEPHPTRSQAFARHDRAQ